MSDEKPEEGKSSEGEEKQKTGLKWVRKSDAEEGASQGREDRSAAPDRESRPKSRDFEERSERPRPVDRDRKPERDDRPKRFGSRDDGDRPFKRENKYRSDDRPKRFEPRGDRDRAPRRDDRSSEKRSRFESRQDSERTFKRPRRIDDRRSEPEVIEWIYGTHPIKEALDAGKELERLLIQAGNDRVLKELASESRKRGIPVQEVPVEKLNRVTRKNHQGAIAYLSPITYSTIEEEVMGCFEKGEEPFILILDGITDVGNFGAICRTAECAGVTAIVVPNRGRAQINAQAVKSSAGALMNIPVCRQPSLKACAEYLKECGLKIVSCTEKTETEVFGSDLTGPLAIVMGSEETGISTDMLALSDAKLAIPMKGKTGSLNVSVAAGVMLFQVSSQRNSAENKDS